MKIEISYPELSFLRDILKEQKMKIWKEVYLPRINTKDTEAIKKSFREMMECEIDPYSSTCSDRECCILLLSKLQKIEQEMNEDIKI
ncbi:hypothetical protein LCGC14_0608780 [marine sediment metagenome]|uniref:Uncharacterized protein n=1 Tax=marine sediment metagenome TaxID=412755 RepID=A0A0F9UGW3_9ZZZZ